MPVLTLIKMCRSPVQVAAVKDERCHWVRTSGMPPKDGSFPSLVVHLSAGQGSWWERSWCRRRSELVAHEGHSVFRETSSCTNTLLTAFRSAFWAFKTNYFNAGSSQLLSFILLMVINCQHEFGRGKQGSVLRNIKWGLLIEKAFLPAKIWSVKM